MYRVKVLDEIFHIKNENELILLFIFIDKNGGELKKVIFWNIIMDLDEKLLDIIKTNYGLVNTLKRLDERRCLLFLNKLSEKLPEILGTSDKLNEILAKFTSNKGFKTQIIRNLRGLGLKKLIKNGTDFKNTIEWLFGDAEDEVFKLLDKEYILSIFSDIDEIVNSIYYLNDFNKDRFINIIGYGKLSSKIFKYEKLANLIKSIPIKNIKLLLKNLGKKRILELFFEEKDFYNFLLSLPQTKERIFLDFLK